MWNGVGGSTNVFAALWPRFRPSDFRKGVEHGLAPDWPISYEDLAPFYDEADRLVRRVWFDRRPGHAAPRALPVPAAADARERPHHRRRVRAARLALVADAGRDHLRKLRWPGCVQRLRQLRVRLPARFDGQDVALAVAACAGGRRVELRPGAPGRANRDRARRQRHWRRLHRAQHRQPGPADRRRRHPRRQRRRLAAAPAAVRERPPSQRPGQRQRRRRALPAAPHAGSRPRSGSTSRSIRTWATPAR